MTLPILAFPAEISREHLAVHACVVSGCVRPSVLRCAFRHGAATSAWCFGRRMIGRAMGVRGRSTKWDKWYSTARWARIRKHQLLEHPLVSIVQSAALRAGDNLRSRRGTSRRCQQILAWSVPIALQVLSRFYKAVHRAARFPSRYWPRWVAARFESSGVSDAVKPASAENPTKPFD